MNGTAQKGDKNFDTVDASYNHYVLSNGSEVWVLRHKDPLNSAQIVVRKEPLVIAVTKGVAGATDAALLNFIGFPIEENIEND